MRVQKWHPGRECALGIWELSGSMWLPGGAYFLASFLIDLGYDSDPILTQT